MRLLLAGLLIVLAGCGRAPSKEEAAAAIGKITPVKFDVLEVSKMQEIPGLYAVAVSINGQPVIYYLDGKARYIVLGNVMRAADRTNITMEAQKKFGKK